MSVMAEISKLPSTTPQLEHPDDSKSTPLTPSDDDKRSLASTSTSTPSPRRDEPKFKSRGVVGVEAMARYAAASKKGKYSLWCLALLIFILQWVVSPSWLSSTTVWSLTDTAILLYTFQAAMASSFVLFPLS